MDNLDLTSLAKAIGQLEAGLTIFAKDDENALLRDGVIQRFEFTYELSHKMLKRFIEATSANPQEADSMTFQELIRVGSEQGLLISGWDKWRDFRKARGTTSHTYDEAKAIEVLSVIPDFLSEAKYLYEQISKKNS
jgi:nucleotidyltransferase substrate binding protein (TIGR01987 family)